ncbi:hypothetical protein [Corallococcus llansteffanensis]|uniref:hypothetical protein n=1 Tax=Corallococcus llansteffanensis TaxID=2316731 RepID=UPI0011C41A28|nr:hypothetical protein [Corallococcus llansteffanensis]
MSRQNWTEVNGIKVNNEVLADLQAKGFIIIMGEDGYPWVAYLPRVCPSCDITHCGHPRPQRRLMWLHHFVWDFYSSRGLRPERNEGDVIHHQRGDKLDARIKRLGRGNPTSHARAHNAKKRLHSPRERHDLGGLRYRPPQPARVVDRPELVGLPAPVARTPPRVPTLRERVLGVEWKLAQRVEALWGEMKGLDSGESIPRTTAKSQWRDSKTRKLGLKMPRYCCTEGEAAFVLLLIRHGFDLERVAQDVGEPVELLAPFYQRPSVNVALQRWREHRRLPAFAPMTWQERNP